MVKRYIRCDGCGKKIYESDRVYYVDGLIYKCCSAGCLGYLLLNVSSCTLNDAFLKDMGEEWGTEE